VDTRPYWNESVTLPQFAPLSNDLTVDVVVVGDGLTGITTAYLLKEAGAKVALLDRQHCASADTAHTTAHLTYATDLSVAQIGKTFWEAERLRSIRSYMIRDRVAGAEDGSVEELTPC